MQKLDALLFDGNDFLNQTLCNNAPMLLFGEFALWLEFSIYRLAILFMDTMLDDPAMLALIFC